MLAVEYNVISTIQHRNIQDYIVQFYGTRYKDGLCRIKTCLHGKSSFYINEELAQIIFDKFHNMSWDWILRHTCILKGHKYTFNMYATYESGSFGPTFHMLVKRTESQTYLFSGYIYLQAANDIYNWIKGGT